MAASPLPSGYGKEHVKLAAELAAEEIKTSRKIDNLRKEVNKRFDAVDTRLDGIDDTLRKILDRLPDNGTAGA